MSPATLGFSRALIVPDRRLLGVKNARELPGTFTYHSCTDVSVSVLVAPSSKITSNSEYPYTEPPLSSRKSFATTTRCKSTADRMMTLTRVPISRSSGGLADVFSSIGRDESCTTTCVPTTPTGLTWTYSSSRYCYHPFVQELRPTFQVRIHKKASGEEKQPVDEALGSGKMAASTDVSDDTDTRVAVTKKKCCVIL